MNAENALALSGVGKSFGGLHAVRGVTMAVPPGQRRALIGPNGAGKTTLFNLIAGDIRVSAGVIELFGKNVTRLPVHKRSRLGIRRTYQTPALFNGLTVHENIYLSLLGCETGWASLNLWSDIHRDAVKAARALEIAASMGLAEKFDHLSADLSHGERKQLEIGVTMAASPRLLLLDEPAAGLSAHERVRIMAILQAIPRDVTIIIIEHDMEMALKLSDVVTVLYEGAIMAEGTPDEISNNAEVQRVYLGEAAHADS